MFRNALCIIMLTSQVLVAEEPSMVTCSDQDQTIELLYSRGHGDILDYLIITVGQKEYAARSTKFEISSTPMGHLLSLPTGFDPHNGMSYLSVSLPRININQNQEPIQFDSTITAHTRMEDLPYHGVRDQVIRTYNVRCRASVR